ncbi:MAG: hypothetical protein KC503_05410 [Myxococcales bacterium]|nr:hypothetical protein [Myxococcales bacterium]
MIRSRRSMVALLCAALLATSGCSDDAAPASADLAADLARADAAGPTVDTAPAGDQATPVDSAKALPRPVVFVHGINGSAKDFDVMIQRLVADGWAAERLSALTYADPSWGCNVDNAAALRRHVQDVMKKTGAQRIDLVAHSMGTLSSRYFIKNLGGGGVVNTYLTLGGMHHGLSSPCLSPFDVCVWKELCASGPFIAQLDADPATPGKLNWVSMFGTGDTSVPNDSSRLDGAENISFPDVEHSGAKGLLEDLAVYAEVKRVLQYPDWK